MSETKVLPLALVNETVAPTSLSDRLEHIRRQLGDFSEAETIRHFELSGHDRVLKTTISLCPDCLGHVPAVVFTVRGRVGLKKRCPDHGFSSAIVENDERFYHLSNKDHW